MHFRAKIEEAYGKVVTRTMQGFAWELARSLVCVDVWCVCVCTVMRYAVRICILFLKMKPRMFFLHYYCEYF